MPEAPPDEPVPVRPPLTAKELHGAIDRRGQLRRVPAVALEALKLVWRASRRELVITLALQALAGVALAFQLLAINAVLTGLAAVTRGEPLSSVVLEFSLLIGTTALAGVIGAITVYQQGLLAELVSKHALDKIITVSASVGMESLESPAFHDQLKRARDAGTLRALEMVNSLSVLTLALMTSAAVALVLAALAPLLLAFVALAAIPVLLANVHNSRKRYSFDYEMTPETRERLYMLQLLTERAPAKEVRVFGSAPFLRARWDALSEERLRQLRSFLRERLLVALAGTTAGSVGTGIALGALVVMVARDQLEVATALTAAVAMQQLGSRLNNITKSIGSLIGSAMFLDDYNTFLGLSPAVDPALDDSDIERAPSAATGFGGLALQRVSFRYPSTGQLVLDDVSLEIEPGEIVALVGENGSGKTTLVKLICQLYPPDAGEILWNGVNARALPARVRSQITVVFQDFVQYHLSVRDNIILGRPEAAPTLEEIEAAARHAGADNYVSRLPHGYDTRLGLQFFAGHELSVGQWQRLALARAFYRGGDFLILDEPTASLDPRAEHDLFVQMRRLAEGRSVLLVTHRFSSVRAADRIYVMHDGRITESGSHDHLMSLGGLYAELFDLQATAYLGKHRTME